MTKKASLQLKKATIDTLVAKKASQTSMGAAGKWEIINAAGDSVLSGNGDFTVLGGTRRYRDASGRFLTLFQTNAVRMLDVAAAALDRFLADGIIQFGESTVVVLTGSGLKAAERMATVIAS